MLPRLAVPWILVAGLASPALATSAVTASATASATSLILDGEGGASTHIVKVADLALTTDRATGFTLTISSGSLTKSGATAIGFQIALVAHGAGAPSGVAFIVASGSNLTLSTTSAGPVEKDLYIQYTPAALQDPGAYGTSIDVSILDN
jgi:hypothetical protein